jgi:hypothetical protein
VGVQAEGLALEEPRARTGKRSEGDPGKAPASGPTRRGAKEALSERDLQWLKGLRAFREVLGKVLEEMDWQVHRSFADPKRRLELGDYLSLFLLGLFNPVARTLRGLVAASQLPGVQRGVCRRSVSLGSFSEAQNLVDPAMLEEIFGRLSGLLGDQVQRRAGMQRERWLVRDSSLFSALPRMVWALYGGGAKGAATAVRLHVSFDLSKDGPVAAQVTPGKACERAVLRGTLRKGDAYIGDRYYAEHYAFFTYLSRQNCRYLIRLIEGRTAVTIEEKIPVSASDVQQGVERQAWARLGKEANGTLSERLRIIWVKGCSGTELQLATNLFPEELSAADAALLYKERWQVEYFFRWVKCLMAEERWHWIAEGPKGVAIQLYLTLIGALLLQLDLGRRPSKRVWELFQWYLCGMLDENSLTERLHAQLAAEAQKRAAKKTTPSI